MEGSHAAELTYITQVITALEHIESVLDDNVPEYHPFRHLVSAFLDGTFIKCASCDNTLSNDDESPMHGLREQIDEFWEVQEQLMLEVQFELNIPELEGEADGEEV